MSASVAVTVPTAALTAASTLTGKEYDVAPNVGGVQAPVSVVNTADGSPHAAA